MMWSKSELNDEFIYPVKYFHGVFFFLFGFFFSCSFFFAVIDLYLWKIGEVSEKFPSFQFLAVL